MDIKDVIVEKIKRLCEEKDITYNELAKRSDLTASTVYSVLDPKRRNINLDTMMSICKGLNITISEFFDDDEFKTC